MFLKDTGSDMTVIREDLVDKSCKLKGHKVTLYTAVGQPFTAQLAVVSIDTPHYKGLDVKRYCTTCHERQMAAKRTAGRKAPVVCPLVITEPFLKIAMDIVGPLSRMKSGNKYVLTVVGDAMRYPEAFPRKDIEETIVTRALIEFV